MPLLGSLLQRDRPGERAVGAVGLDQVRASCPVIKSPVLTLAPVAVCTKNSICVFDDVTESPKLAE